MLVFIQNILKKYFTLKLLKKCGKKLLKFFLWILFILIIGILFFNLYDTLADFENSFFYSLSKSLEFYPPFETLTKEIDIWAIRGQIGDILAGTFSALAFFTIALTIYLQSEGNKQIQKSIEQQENLINQQKDALEIQSKALKVQTEEFISNNLNMRLEKYYLLVDKHLEIVTEEYLYGYLDNIYTIGKCTKYRDYNFTKIEKLKKITNDQATKIRPIVMTLNFIYGEIINIKKTSPSAYQTYIEELRLRLYSNEIFRIINTQIDEYNETPVFNLYTVTQ